jgi:hypothetical protein
MNATSTTFTHIASIPATLYQSASALTSRFSYIQVPHIKLKAEHQAMVIWHLVKMGMTYWQGWRDGKKGGQAGEAVGRDSRVTRGGRPKRRKANGGKRRKVVGKGKYTVVFQ